MRSQILTVLAGIAVIFPAAAVFAQPAQIDCAGQNLTYVGPQVQDFFIPEAPGTELHVRVQGADGGDAEAGGNNQCKSTGGKGAVAEADYAVGTGTGQLPPGGTLRFIIGRAGFDRDNNNGTGGASAGGGGGSAVLYRATPSDEFTLLLAAGAGGGAYQGIFLGACVDSHPGDDAQTGDCGTEGGNVGGFGGCNGNAGNSMLFAFSTNLLSGGGGGYYYWHPPASIGGVFGGSTGGAGGVGTVNGGWGCGGGGGSSGGGGGGGGWSGGGGGDLYWQGGGGGSHVNTAYGTNHNLAAGVSGDGRNGAGSIDFLNRQPNDIPATAISFNAGDALNGTTCPGGGTHLGMGCNPPEPRGEVWYQYTNSDSACSRTLQFSWTTPNLALSLHNPAAIGTPIACSNTGTLATEVGPLGSILVRITTPLTIFTVNTQGGLADLDGDGICNELDECATGDDTADCNHNDVPDCAESISNSRTVGQNFNTTGQPFQLNGTAVLDAGTARLVNNVANTRGTLVFHTLNPTDRIGHFQVDFDFKIGSAPGQINEGLVFAALAQTETSPWSLSSTFGEDIFAADPLDALLVNFNTYNTGVGPDNSVWVMRNAGGIGGAIAPSFDMDNAQWHHARITLDAFTLTIVLTPNGGSPQTVLSENIFPFYDNPFYFAFAAGNTASTTTGRTWIDNVRIIDLSNDDDCDQDGIPDGCDSIGCQAPLNDECSGALPVGLGDTLFNNSDATGIAITTCSHTDPRDIWFTYTPACSGTVRFEASHGDVTWIPTLALYASCSTELQCARNNAPNNGARIDRALTAEVPVLIRVAGWLFNAGDGVLHITYLSDSDGDGVPDGCDRCPGFNDLEDADGDGVPDACDICPGYDDTADDDSDGVPNACDICPNGPDNVDSDSDGVPDGCDRCGGSDDSLDADGDSVPDGCDVCPGSSDGLDCDNNLIADCQDLAHPGRFEDFGGVGQMAYALNANANANPAVDAGSLRLTQAEPSETASVVFNPVSDQPTGSFTASFDFKIGPGTNSGADGMSFAVLDAGSFDSTALWGEDGPGGNSLAVSFDTYFNGAPEPSGNFIELRYLGTVLAQYVPTFTLENAQWHHVEITFDGSSFTLVVTPNGGSPETAFNAVSVPGFAPFVARYGFGARTGSDTNEQRVDNVRFVDTSANNDIDGDGVSNACDVCPNRRTGDVDGDGAVNVNDVSRFNMILLDPGSATPDEFCAANVNRDGNVDGLDIQGFVALLIAP